MMIKLSDFARQQGVTPRAVQKLLQKYEAEIEGHFERKGQNGTWFDDYAQDFLRSKMLQKPVVVYDETASPLLAENKELRDKVDRLKDELNEAYKALAEDRAKTNELQVLLTEKTTEQKYLVEKIETNRQTAEAYAQEAEQAKKEAEALRSELQRLKNRGFFARLFNRE